MSKLLSEEQIKQAFFKSFKKNAPEIKGFITGLDCFNWAFTLLMPIIEKQDEIIKELLEVAEIHLDDTMEKIQETKQMLKGLGK